MALAVRSRKPLRWIDRSFSTASGDCLLWEELEPLDPPPESVSRHQQVDEEAEPTRNQRYYIPPPLTDLELQRLSLSKVSDWPKSRVIWALGRIGFVDSLKQSRGDLFRTLVDRAGKLIDDLNTRDTVRIIQAISYGPALTDPAVLLALRRKLFTSMDKISEPFLISFMFGHLKLTQRLDWKRTDNCKRATQFLLSEFIHRKSKIDAQRFLEISGVLLSESIRESHTDSVQTIIRHAVSDALQHVRSAPVLEQFGKALCGVAADEHFISINEKLEKKFRNIKWKSAEDAMRIGFYFWLNNLISVNTCNSWLDAVRNASIPLPMQLPAPEPSREKLSDYHSFLRESRRVVELVQMKTLTALLIEKRGFSDLIDLQTVEWLNESCLDFSKANPLVLSGCRTVDGLSDPVLGCESEHVSRVLRRMVRSMIKESVLRQETVGSFVVAVGNADMQICIEWRDQSVLEVPYRRNLSSLIQDLRRKYLTDQGWKIILLDRHKFRLSSETDIDAINKLFKEDVSARAPQIEWKDEPVDTENLGGKPSPVLQLITDEQTRTRQRRESRSREYRLKSSLGSIRRQFRKKMRKFQK